MNDFRKGLVDRMIHLYGFKNEMVIQFCELCEKWSNNEWNDKVLSLLVESHEAESIFENEES